MKNIILTLLLIVLSTGVLSAKVYDFTSGNKIELMEDPHESADIKVDLINKAKHHVHIITFFWDESSLPARLAAALNEANKRGVEVRILTTAFPTFTTDLLGKGRRKLNISDENKFIYLALSPGRYFSMTHSLHEKIFLVDGEVAIIGGRNVSDSSFNGKDLEVKMQGEVVGQIQDHFKIMFDFLLDMKVKSQCMMSEDDSCEKSLNNLKFSSDNLDFFPKQTVFEDGEEARLLSHEAVIHHFQKKMNREERLQQRDDILDTVINIPFKTLKAYQYFMMPTERFKNYLNENLDKGNKIEIITNSLESGKFSSNSGYIYALPDTLDFVERGMAVYQWERNQKLHYVHEKVLIFDNEQVIIGSHNFVTGSTGVSNEIAVQIKSKNLAEKLSIVFDEEKNNASITKKVESSFLKLEMNELKKKIKFFRGRIIKGVLREIY